MNLYRYPNPHAPPGARERDDRVAYRIITIANQKGGVGKSTTAQAMTSGLLMQGQRVLLIDTDPQANSTMAFGVRMQGVATARDVMLGKADAADAVQHAAQGDIMPGDILLASADSEFTRPGREHILRKALLPLKEQYDFIVIDTPPSLGMLTFNALTAAHDVIIPLNADLFSFQGLMQLSDIIEMVTENCNPDMRIAGLLLTRFRERTVVNKSYREEIERQAQRLRTSLFNTFIRDSIAVSEAQSYQESIFARAPKSNIALDYLNLIAEYLEGVNALGQ